MSKFDHTRPFKPLNIALYTISDTRTAHDDKSGDILEEKIKKSGHILSSRKILKDNFNDIKNEFLKKATNPECDIILSTGGTGLTGRDLTPDVVEDIADKIIPGFGELFRMLSFSKIGTSTIQSRAIAGLIKGTYVFCLPGSPGACRDGWDDILKFQLDYRFKPCNFVELIPRLQET